MGPVVLDASVIIAVFDPLDTHHLPALSAIQRAHADGHRFLVPASVLAEVLVGEARRNGGIVEHRTAAVSRLFGACRVIDEEVAAGAARLRARHRALRLPDALVIAVAVVDGATSIVTADKRWAGIDPRVEVL